MQFTKMTVFNDSFINVMYRTEVLLYLLLVFMVFFYRRCESGRIYFSRCGAGGFSCVTNNGKYKITYQCPVAEKDVTFYLWQFRAPANIEAVTINNCTTFRLSFLCTNENRPITNLLVANITNLYIIKSTFTHNPQTIRFENIKNLEYIPGNAFSQIKKRIPVGGCVNPVRDFQNLYFNRVGIGVIAPNAFNDLRDFYNFSWYEVKVERLQHSAVQLEFNKAGNFSIRRSNLEVSEHLAFRIVGREALFVENKFVDIYSSAINGSIGSFIFAINSVNNLQSYGISVLAENVHISDNRFEYLKSGALEKISPGLLENSQRNFGKLRFIYEFNHNTINFMDAASLNPDMQAYDNVATDLKFTRNTFFCSCENLGWLFSETGHGYNTALLQDFYEIIVDEEYKNTCSYTSCDLPLSKARNLLENGKCLNNDTAENLCKVKENIKVNGTVTTKPEKIFASKFNGAGQITYFSLSLLYCYSFPVFTFLIIM